MLICRYILVFITSLLSLIIMMTPANAATTTQTIVVEASFIMPITVSNVTSLMLHVTPAGISPGLTTHDIGNTFQLLTKNGAGVQLTEAMYIDNNMINSLPLLVTGFTLSGNDIQSVNFVMGEASTTQNSAVCKYGSGSASSCNGMTGAPPEKGKSLLIGIPVPPKGIATLNKKTSIPVTVLYN